MLFAKLLIATLLLTGGLALENTSSNDEDIEDSFGYCHTDNDCHPSTAYYCKNKRCKRRPLPDPGL